MAIDPLKKSYRDGRRDQLDLDHDILKKGNEQCESKEDLYLWMENRLDLVSEKLKLATVKEIKDEHGIL